MDKIGDRRSTLGKHSFIATTKRVRATSSRTMRMMCSTMRWRTLKCSNRPTKTLSTRQHYSSSSATINNSIRTVWRREPRQTLTLSILTATKVLGRSRKEREHHPTFFEPSTFSKTLSKVHRINFIALGKIALIIATRSYRWSFFSVIWNKT